MRDHLRSVARPPLDVIFCHGGRSYFNDIAAEEGWLIGARSDTPLYGPCAHHRATMIDWNFTRPDWPRHIDYIREQRPRYATAPDIFDAADLAQTEDQVAAIAEYAQHVIVVPKSSGIIDRIMTWPRAILGYSVPTVYGGTEVPLWEFADHPVHLLGGSPAQQVKLSQYLRVISVDCKMHLRAANYGKYYNDQLLNTLISEDEKQDETGLRACFRISSRNIIQNWRRTYVVNNPRD